MVLNHTVQYSPVQSVVLTSITLRKGLTILNFGVSSGLGWLGICKYFFTASCLSTILCATDTTLLAVQYKKTPYRVRHCRKRDEGEKIRELELCGIG
jgi:hypothetical protein